MLKIIFETILCMFISLSASAEMIIDNTGVGTKQFKDFKQNDYVPKEAGVRCPICGQKTFAPIIYEKAVNNLSRMKMTLYIWHHMKL